MSIYDTIESAIARADRSRGKSYRPDCNFCRHPHKPNSEWSIPHRGISYCSEYCAKTDTAWFEKVHRTVMRETDKLQGREWQLW